MLLLASVVLAAVYAFADRFAGGGWPALDDKLPGRAAFWGALLAAAAGFVLCGPAGALMGLAWLVWRTPAWKLLPGSSATPRKPQEIAATLLRHTIPIPLSLPVCIWTGHEPLRLAVVLGVFAAVSTAFAFAYAKGVDEPGATAEDAEDGNTMLELARGAVYGACVAVGLGG